MRCSIIVRYLAVTVALISAICDGHADSPASPRHWELPTKSGQYLFEMVPPEFRQEGDEFIVTREAYGVAYQKNGKKRTEIWRVEGIYTFQGFLSEDGRYLVAMGPWASDHEGLTDVAFTIYDRGQLVKEYLVKDLVKDRASVGRSTSHYEWVPSVQGKETGIYGKTFHLVTIEKDAYTFDLEAGGVLSESQDAEAFTRSEIAAKEDEAAAKRGLQLYENASFKSSFDNAFDVSGIRAGKGIPADIFLSGPVWTAYLTPKKNLPINASVNAVFPIVDDQRLEVSLTPAEVEKALLAGYMHPYFAKFAQSNAKASLYMRIGGDRLHWKTGELQRLHQLLKGRPIPEADLRRWAQLGLSADAYLDPRGYLNTDTGELICEEFGKDSWHAILLDAKGERLAVKDLRAAGKSIP